MHLKMNPIFSEVKIIIEKNNLWREKRIAENKKAPTYL